MALFRLYRVIETIYQYRLYQGLPSLKWYWRLFITLGLLLFPRAWIAKKSHLSNAERFTNSLISLGPLTIKIGQVLSMRGELFPADYQASLATLRDNVPPFDSQTLIDIVTKALGSPPEQLFAEFNPKPLAAASIAQVHEVTLHDGSQAVIKVLRPNILQAFQADLRLLIWVVRLITLMLPSVRPLHPIKIMDEIKAMIGRECDLRYEAANLSLVRHHFKNDARLHHPRIHWEFSRENTMVIDKVIGIPIDNMDELKARNINFKTLAHNGVAIFFTQIFEHGFFHADMHPGNIFVNCDDPAHPQYRTIDFGIMGSVTPADQETLAKMFLAFFQRDYRALVLVLQSAGWAQATSDPLLTEGYFRQVLEPFFDQPLANIAFGQILMQLFQAASQIGLQVPPHLILLQKTLFNIEALGKRLYPELDLWETAEPFLAKWKKTQYGRRGMWRQVKAAWPHWVQEAPHLPHLLHQVLEKQLAPQPKQSLAHCHWWAGCLIGLTIGLAISLMY